jgi:hypothetical protein
MTPKKMLVVYLSSTKAVVGATSRRAAGAPAATDLVGPALLIRGTEMEAGVAIAASDLAVKEVDLSDDVFRQPLNHGLDSSDSVVAVAPAITNIACSNAGVTLTLSANAVADKSAVVVIDAGANRDPLKFTVKTTATNSVTVPVNGVPTGSHDVFASVEGFASFLDNGGF